MNATAAVLIAGLAAATCMLIFGPANKQVSPAKPETLTCVRVKEVTPAGTINYLCEVRK